MKQRYWRGLFGSILLFASNAVAAEKPSWRVERGAVDIVVPLKPGGAFNATTSSLEGTLTLEATKPALLTGEIAMDLKTIDTGIRLRNQHLRDKYLEVWRGKGFDRAALSELRLDGVDSEAFQGRTAFTGALALHGVKRPVEGTAEIAKEGANRRVRAEFRVTLTDFDIEPPEYLGVGVANKLLIKVLLLATPAPEPSK